MTRKLFLTVSTFAILGITPYAQAAEETSTNTQAEQETSISTDIKEGWNKTKEGVSDAADSVADTTGDAYESIKASIIDLNNEPVLTEVSIDTRMTAAGMIGQPVYGINGERIAKVEDIILNRDGEAIMVILSDGDFTGLGKNVAFEYDVITQREENGDIIADLSEEAIEQAMSFSYDRSDYSEDVQVIPSNGFSIANLMDSHVVGADGSEMANVENISFRNGRADQLIAQFDDFLGLGGEQVALQYDSLTITRNEDAIDFQLSSEQTAEFEAYKNMDKNN